MITSAWYLAIYINQNNNWKLSVQRAMDEKQCLWIARDKWKKYWLSGNEDDSKLRLKCYDDNNRTQYWITCTRYDSCSIKG